MAITEQNPVEKLSEYEMRQLPSHLAHADRIQALHRLLSWETAEGRNAWFSRLDAMGRTDWYLEAVELALRLVRQTSSACAPMGKPVASIGLEVRYSVIVASIVGGTAEVPPALLSEALKRGIWPETRALALARQNPRPVDRCYSLIAILPHMTGRQLSEAQTALLAEDAGDLPLAALAALPENLQAPLLDVAVSAAWEMEYPMNRLEDLIVQQRDFEDLHNDMDIEWGMEERERRAERLLQIAPLLPEEQRLSALREVLDTVWELAEGVVKCWFRVDLLEEVASLAPESMLLEALQNARNIPGEWRAEAMIVLGAGLPPAACLPVLLDAWAAVRTAASFDPLWHAEQLIRLALLLPETERAPVLREAVEAARKVDAPEGREETLARALAYLVACVPSPMRRSLAREALAAAQRSGDEVFAAEISVSLASRLTKTYRISMMRQALESVRHIRDEEKRQHALEAVLPHLPKSLLVEAWNIAGTISRSDLRADVMTQVLRRAPRANRLPFIRETLDAALCADDGKTRDRVLTVLAVEISVSLASRLTKVSRVILIREALESVRSIKEEEKRVHALAAVLPYLPKSHLGEARDIAGTINGSGFRADALTKVLQHTPHANRLSLIQETLGAAHRADAETRDRVLTALAPELPDPSLEAAVKEAVQSRRKIADGKALQTCLISLIAQLPAAAQDAPEVRRAMKRIDKVHALALFSQVARSVRCLDGPLSELMLSSARAMEGERKVTALIDLVPRFPPTRRWSVVCEVLEEVRGQTDICDLTVASLVSLARFLPEDVLRRVLTIARSYDFHRANILAELGPYLSAALLLEAKAIAQMPGAERAQALAAIAAHVGPAEKSTILKEAEQAALSMELGPTRVSVLLDLARQMSDVERPRMLRKALYEIRTTTERRGTVLTEAHTARLDEVFERAREIHDEAWRVEMLMEVASCLPPADNLSVLWEALDAAGRLEPRPYSPAILACAARRLPEADRIPLLQKALDAATHIESESTRATELAQLGPYLTETLLLKAVEEARGIRQWEDRLCALADLTPCVAALLSGERLYSFWRGALSVKRTWIRNDLLAELGALAPIIGAVGGTEATVEAVRAVDEAGRWWQ
jgi:hypothetical protein